MTDMTPFLERIAQALEALAPKKIMPLPAVGNRFLFANGQFQAANLAALPMDLLVGIDEQKARFCANLYAFLAGNGANHALLWGAPGAGKSALVKSAVIEAQAKGADVALVAYGGEDFSDLGPLLGALSAPSRRSVLFLDDLAFSQDSTQYRALKPILDGLGNSGQNIGSGNCLIVATSNLRHLIDRQGAQVSTAGSIRPDEVNHEQLALSDRFGLWLGFYPLDQEDWFSAIQKAADYFGLSYEWDGLKAEAVKWQALGGARSGRSAFQFVSALAGGQGRALKL